MKTLFQKLFSLIKSIFKRKTIQAIQFTDKEGKSIDLFLDMKIHHPHEGECKADMNCKLSPIISLKKKKAFIIAETTEAIFDYAYTNIQSIYYVKGN